MPAIEELIEPLRADPAAAAVLLDIDGTLAPIVRHASDATVPEQTRMLLIECSRRSAPSPVSAAARRRSHADGRDRLDRVHRQSRQRAAGAGR